MKILRLIEVGAIVQLARVGLNRRRRAVQRRQWRNRSLGIFTLAAGAVAAWTALSLLRSGQPEPQWPSKKKLAKKARRAEASRRAHQPVTARPPVIHVETNASPDLKVPLRDLSR